MLSHSCLAAGMLCAQMQEEEGRSAGRRLPSQMQKVQGDAIQKGALLGTALPGTVAELGGPAWRLMPAPLLR